MAGATTSVDGIVSRPSYAYSAPDFFFDAAPATVPGSVYDVRDYGAVGDGSTDDRAAIQSAIDAASAAGGGVVYLPPGTYGVTGQAQDYEGALELRDNVFLKGAGMGQSTIRLIDGWQGDINGIVRSPNNEITKNFGVADLTIDGNRANTEGKVYGFYCGVLPNDPRADEDVYVLRVQATDNSAYGFDPHAQTFRLLMQDNVADHNGLDGFTADFQIDAVFVGNLAYANDRHGFQAVTSSNDILFLDNVASDNGSAGLVIQRGGENIPQPYNIVVRGGTYEGNAREGIVVRMAHDVLIDDVVVQGNGTHGIGLYGAEHITVENSQILDSSQSANGTFSGISVDPYDDTDGASGATFGSADVYITGNDIEQTGPIAFRYAIEEDLSPPLAQGTIVAGNAIGTGSDGQVALFGAGGGWQQTGTDAADLYIGSDQPDQLDGAGGNDTIDGGNGSDVLAGDTGDDVLSGGNDPDSLDGGAGNDTLDGGNDADALQGGGGADSLVGESGSDSLLGGDGNDVLDGGLHADVISGDGGDDTLIGGEGRDSLDGGPGTDAASYDDASVGVTVNLGLSSGPDGGTLNSIENLIGSQFDDTLFGNPIVNLLDGGLGNDLLGGGAADDTLIGSAGDDTLVGGTGADALVGGAGTDAVSYDDNPTGVTVNLGLSTGPDGDTLNSIENLTGSHFDDTLFGNPSNNVIVGGLGNNVLAGGVGEDTLIGSIGDDMLIGGSGADVLNGGTGTDTASYDDNPTSVTVNLGLSNGPDGDTLTSIENLTGSHFDDTLFGNPTDNVIAGGLGDNVLAGGAGNDILIGSVGNDLLIGGSGADILEGGAGTDTASYDDNPTSVTVNLGLSTGPDGDTLSSIENLTGSHFDDTLFGNPTDNVIAGGLGDNVLAGGAGNDTLIGSVGNDLLIGGSGADILEGGAGTDTASYDDNPTGIAVNLGLSTGPDDDTLTSIENLTGSHFDDTLFGNGAVNVLAGGLGNDTLGGGPSDDLFVFGPSAGNDTITDFTPGAGTHDKIDLVGIPGRSSFDDILAHTAMSGPDAVIDLGDGNSITLVGVDLGYLHQDDFLF